MSIFNPQTGETTHTSADSKPIVKNPLRWDRLLRLFTCILGAALAGYWSWGTFETPLFDMIGMVISVIIGGAVGSYAGRLLEFSTWTLEVLKAWLYEPKRN